MRKERPTGRGQKFQEGKLPWHMVPSPLGAPARQITSRVENFIGLGRGVNWDCALGRFSGAIKTSLRAQFRLELPSVIWMTFSPDACLFKGSFGRARA